MKYFSKNYIYVEIEIYIIFRKKNIIFQNTNIGTQLSPKINDYRNLIKLSQRGLLYKPAMTF